METITSRKNELLVHLKKLAADGTYRRERGEFLCDSPKLLAEALQWEVPLTAVVSTDGTEVAGVRCVQVPRDVMESVSPMKTPQGVLFSCRLPGEEVPETLPGKHYVVLDGVQDPGNVGTVLRTLDAFDFDGLILLENCADPYQPKTVRASMGAIFRRPVYQMTAEEMAHLLQRSDLPLFGAALREDTEDVRTVDMSRCAVAIGSEGRGLTETVLRLCDKTVKIPMSTRCESLNAAMAAGVILWEAYRKE